MQDDLMRTISDLLLSNPDNLSPLGVGVLAAAHLGLSHDSRSFAARLGVAHALVLRECVALAEEHHLIDLEGRGDRSQRVFFALSERGQTTLAGISAR